MHMPPHKGVVYLWGEYSMVQSQHPNTNIIVFLVATFYFNKDNSTAESYVI